ncbi:MAG: cytochrome d ubiquinol oxidase subunit II [Acidobacteria bacterium]|nr:cytochrome d ubiquinol oxidase subunit II [Acidobacteriota bacterium]
MTILGIIWFFLLGVLFIGYSILDGFDLGVGVWHLRGRRDEERRTMLNSIGPVWDGNEVWLISAGGVLFGAFPSVYATVFSGFYLALMLILLVLMLRAIAFEFRSKHESPRWRNTWDIVFSLSSIVATILFGVALGNILRGVPLDKNALYTAGFLALLNPYALLIGVLSLAMFAYHGALYIVMKAPGELENRARGWAGTAGMAYLILFVIASVFTAFFQPHLLRNYGRFPALWALPIITICMIVFSTAQHRRGRCRSSFIASSASIALMWLMVGAGLYPNLVPALGMPERSINIANGASSDSTLLAMLVIAVLFLPLVVGYTIWVYRVFKGKVDVSSEYAHY